MNMTFDMLNFMQNIILTPRCILELMHACDKPILNTVTDVRSDAQQLIQK